MKAILAGYDSSFLYFKDAVVLVPVFAISGAKPALPFMFVPPGPWCS